MTCRIAELEAEVERLTQACSRWEWTARELLRCWAPCQEGDRSLLRPGKRVSYKKWIATRIAETLARYDAASDLGGEVVR